MMFNVWFAECEDCKSTVEGNTKAELVENMSTAGWLSTNWGGKNRHLCPDHRADFDEAARS